MIFSNRFRQKIESGYFVTSIEINPAKNADLQKNFREVALCAPFVDVVNVTDSSMARMTPASFIVAAMIQKHFDIDAVFNYTCRDRNIIALKSDLLGALALGVENVLALTGDPPPAGDHPKAKGVYEFGSGGLLELIHNIKSPVGEFFAGGVINFTEKEENARKIVAKKKEKGVRFLISQPVYSIGRIKFLAELQKEFDVPILAGILPIKSRKVGKYMQEKVIGITIPPDDYEKILKFNDEEIFHSQIEKAAELYSMAKSLGLAGAHIMPLGRGDKIPEIIGYEHS